MLVVFWELESVNSKKYTRLVVELSCSIEMSTHFSIHIIIRSIMEFIGCIPQAGE